MPGPYDPLTNGFLNFSEARNIAINGAIQPTHRSKLAGSVLTIKEGHPLIVGALGTYDRAAVTGGVNEQDTLTFAGTVTSFTLAFTGPTLTTGVSVTRTTPVINYNADFTVLARNVQDQLQLLDNTGVDNVSVVRTSATVLTVTFTGLLGSRNVAILVSGSVVGGGSVTVATSVAGTAGYISSASLLGFADRNEKGTISNWQRHFAQPIDLNLDGEVWTDPLKMCIFPLRDQIFRASVEPWVALDAATHLDQTYPIGWFATREQCYLATEQATNAVATIVNIAPDQQGVMGGIADFIITSAAIALT
jgi:hypothetical protein